MIDLFAQLDHDWHANHAHLPAPPGPVAVPGPRGITVDELVQLANGRGDPAASDAILAGFARRAAHDDLAARALLQAILPGLKALAASHYWLAPRDDLTATIVATAWERIRRYPIGRRPQRVAANLLADTAHLTRRAFRRDPTTDGAQPIPERTPSVSEELIALIQDAVDEGRLSEPDARLILSFRVHGERINHAARRVGVKPNTMSRRRLRAELRLLGAA